MDPNALKSAIVREADLEIVTHAADPGVRVVFEPPPMNTGPANDGFYKPEKRKEIVE